MLNVPAATLRAWEERYSLVSPVRSAGSQRLYTRGQLEQLRFIKAQIDSGVSAADAHRLLAEQVQSGPRPPLPSVTSDGSQPLVLVADRDPYSADLVVHFLRAEGYAVDVALDAATAVRKFEERTPAAVVVDLLLSGKEGFRLVTEFGRSGKTQVVATASLDAGGEATEAGAAAFFKKPIEPPLLLARLRDLLGDRAAGPSRNEERRGA